MTTIAQAINSLDVKNERSGSASVSDPVSNASEFEAKITWHDKDGADIASPYTWAEVKAEFDFLVAVETANVYQQKRREAYASIGDQLDMQWHDAQDGTTTWVDHVAAVKAAHPKP